MPVPDDRGCDRRFRRACRKPATRRWVCRAPNIETGALVAERIAAHPFCARTDHHSQHVRFQPPAQARRRWQDAGDVPGQVVETARAGDDGLFGRKPPVGSNDCGNQRAGFNRLPRHRRWQDAGDERGEGHPQSRTLGRPMSDYQAERDETARTSEGDRRTVSDCSGRRRCGWFEWDLATNTWRVGRPKVRD